MNAADPRVARTAFALALLAVVAPLWCARQPPMVDLPQHLHLISVLHRLDDPTTLYPQVFAARAELTPSLGSYSLVSLLSWLVPLELMPPQALTMLGCDLRFDASKARAELGWRPQPFDAVLAETVAALRARGLFDSA